MTVLLFFNCLRTREYGKYGGCFKENVSDVMFREIFNLLGITFSNLAL